MGEATLTTAEVLLWGGVGGLVALAVTQILPALLVIGKSGTGPKLTPWTVIAFIGIGLIFIGAAAVVALIFRNDDTRLQDAIAFGMAWQALIGGVFKSGKAVID